MKRIVLLFGFILALALCASAQTYIDFHDMAFTKAPSPMPDAYPASFHLSWDNFYYVTPGLWKEAGPGFWVDPATYHNTVAFIGGKMCPFAVTCAGAIKIGPSIGMTPVAKDFTPVSMTLSAGWASNTVTVLGYNNGKFVGSLVWKLTTTPITKTSPNTWRVSELVFTPGVPATGPAVFPKSGSVVIYSFILVR